MSQTYRALTRAYRPQSFDDIVSQEHVSNTLKNAIRKNRISHAYMFCGPRGVGKTTMARVLARVVNSVDQTVDGESLNQTLNIVEMDAASNRKIDDVRSLKEVIRVPPQSGRYKIFIIDEVHMLTKEAFNALLKTLEEPPAHVIFIFATTEPHKVLPTILSRVQRFDFKRITVSEIVRRLRDISTKESIEIDDESLHVIAKRADGALRDALGLMDQVIAFCGESISYQETLKALNVVDADHLFTMVEYIRKRESHQGLQLIDQLLRDGTDIQEFLVSLTEHLRNLYIAKGESTGGSSNGESGMKLVEATEETRKRYLEQSADIAEDDLMRMLFLVSEAQFKIKEAQQPRVHFEVMLLKLVHMHRSARLNELLSGLEELKKKLDGQELTATQSTVPVENKESSKKPVAPVETQTTPQASSDDSKQPQAQEDTVVTKQTPPQEKSIDIKQPSLQADDEDDESQVPNVAEVPDVPNITAVPEVAAPDSVGKSGGADTSGGSGEGDIFGRPALSRQLDETVPEVDPEPKNQSPVNTRKIDSLDDVIGVWPEFLDTLQKSAPKMLHFQVQRADLRELLGRELHLAVENEFAHKIVVEHKILLSRLLKETIGASLQIECSVDKGKADETKSVSPYERFKKLQQQDPNIRAIVELFGAELEY